MAIAREFPHAEAAFVFAADAPTHDVRVRFYNARKEAPFVGHATIAAHAVLLAAGRRGLGVCRQMSGTGILDVAVHAHPTGADPGGALIEFRQSVPELGNPLPLKTTLRVAEALRLPGARLHDTLPARLATKGGTRLLLPIADAEGLAMIEPNFGTLAALGAELGADGFFVFAHRAAPDDGSTDSRMFCPALGIPEDPVSGNAHAMLATYLWQDGRLAGRPSFTGRQGLKMRRPGEVRVTAEIERGELLAVRIAGRAVIVSEGTLAA
jgi:PhzF family phenazine biosynthesis protein